MPRLKKLTDYTYSPTNPSSEDAIRSQIDDSIQEVYDASPRAGDTVNLTGNQTISDVKTFSSSPIVPTPTSASQVANKSYVDGVAISATIPLDSLTDDYLASAPGNIKPRVATLETDFATAQSDITNLETDIEIITTAIQDVGTVNAIVVDTLGTFDLTKNGNVTPFIIPLFTNTSSTVNINIDGQGNKLVKKANDSGVMVALEVGDIKKNVPIQLIRDSVNDFFIFAPKGNNPLKVWGNQTVANNPSLGATAVTNRLTVNGSGWVIALVVSGGAVDNIRLTIDGVVKIGGASQSTSTQARSTRILMFRFNSNFVYADASGYCSLVYCLGDVFEKSKMSLYAPGTASSTTIRTTVSGKGWIYGMYNISGTSSKLIIDGLEVYNKPTAYGYPILIRFESGFEFYDGDGFTYLNYVLD